MWVREEKYWAQRSRVKWLTCGDRNSKLFHMTAIQRRQRNKVVKLKSEDDNWIDNPSDIGECFKKFYSDLFEIVGLREYEDVLDYVQPVISEDTNAELIKLVSFEEIKGAAFGLGALKAPGPDGYSGLFYQHAWQTVGDQVCSLVQSFFQDDLGIDRINHTNLVMIPKVDNPEQVGHFRPISLCNFSYKIISKVISNRMKPIMPNVITENQRAFVHGRQIHDNIFVVHEAFHYLRSRVHGKKYELAVKVDMNKAYDRVEWDFLKDVLLKMGFAVAWVEKILKCISSVSFDLLLSGKFVANFAPRRGLRQGDPLSPYLFILVADVLSIMLNSLANSGDIRGIKLARSCPMLTHCLFADDSVFFLKADVVNCSNFKKCLADYCRALGQLVNLGKSCVFFTDNTPDDLKMNCCNILGIEVADSPGKYLGLPILWGRSKSEALAFVRDRVKGKVQGWKHSLLSHGGREVLIRSVANSIPTYSMSCFLFPKKTCSELNSIISNFWWGNQSGNGSIHWVAWSKLSKSKKVGGLGFKDFLNFNLALLAKQGWRIICNPNDLWVRILKSIYFPKTDFLHAVKGARSSWAWPSILQGRSLLLDKMCWAVGNGRDINFWRDPWIPRIPSFKLASTPPFEVFVDATVAEFIINGKWDLSNVECWLSDDEVKAIKSILISLRPKGDCFKWTGADNGTYTVKLGYKYACSRDVSCPISKPVALLASLKKLWKCIWNLKSPLK